MSDSDSPIVFEDVHRHFDEKAVLQGLTLKVRPGQIHALLGRNGCGKTTALRILLGFLVPHRGHSRILGRDSQALDANMRGRIGYVNEGHNLYRGMRVDEVIGFERSTRSRFDETFARAALGRCGLRDRIRVGQLSRGQRAQLALVVAVASQPEILVCDDPALGLDVVMRRELLEVLIDLLSDRGTPVLFSSHFLADVERVADRVSILSDGRLMLDATIDDLKRRVVARIWRAHEGDGPPAALPGVIRQERRREGYQILLVDAGETTVRTLAETGRLGEPVVPSLEDLFIALTRDPDRRIVVPVTPSQKEVAA